MVYFHNVKNVPMDSKVKQYLKNEFYRGKSLAARLIDSIFLKILAFMVIFIFFWIMHRGFWGSVILAASAVSSFGILKFVYNRSRYSSFSRKKLERVAEECALEKMILLRPEKCLEIAGKIFADELQAEAGELTSVRNGFLMEETYCCYFDVHPKHTVSIEEITKTVRDMRALNAKKCVLLTPSHFDAEARAVAVRSSDSCIFLESKELLKRLKNTELYPNEREVLEYLGTEIAEKRITREKLFDAFFSADKGRSFALCAGVLMVLPLITGFNIIYPVAAAVCTVLSIFGFMKSRKRNS